MTRTTKKTAPRRPYRRPTVERIRLRPEDAVLSACKNPGWGGCSKPGQPGGRTPGS